MNLKSNSMKTFLYSFAVAQSVFVILGFIVSRAYGQDNDQNKISIQSSPAGGNVHFIYCVDGFGGGNVAASIGEDGILLVDNMYAFMAPKLEAHLKTISTKPIRIVLNTHFHRDHIDANTVFKKSTVIIAHENVSKQLFKNNQDKARFEEINPMVTFTDRLTVNFNGEEIQLIHCPNSHTDGDAAIYFTKSKVLHLGDMFFFGMFPAVYAQGGGDVKQLIVSLEKLMKEIPADAKVVPGHGELATMKDLGDYTDMLKKTVAIVEAGIKQGKSLEKMTSDKVLAAYDALGNGGAQTTEQYLGMLYKLLATSSSK